MTETVEIDYLKTLPEFYGLPNILQKVDVLIEGPVTEREDVFVYKPSQYLMLAEKAIFSELPIECIVTTNILRLSVPETITSKPGVNFITVKTPLTNGIVHSNYYKQHHEVQL